MMTCLTILRLLLLVKRLSLLWRTLRATLLQGLMTFLPYFINLSLTIMGADITNTILKILNNIDSPKSYNNTCIILILKVKNSIKPSEYMHVALCNVFMKIITKVLNRLKVILPSIIGQNQSAFVHKRLISDNTMVAHEAFHKPNR